MSISIQQARSIIRKAVKRVPEGEDIRHLNIMPMMDMMTILLVAFIFQVATGAAALTAGTVSLPTSKSQEALLAEGASMLIITPKAIVVESEEVVAVRNGKVDPSQKEGGALGLKINRLTKYLSALRRSNEADAAKKGQKLTEVPELFIIADSQTPYRLLIECIFSAKSKESGYKRFRLVVLKPEIVSAKKK
jgi:biopolymer transport protein ExbD